MIKLFKRRCFKSQKLVQTQRLDTAHHWRCHKQYSIWVSGAHTTSFRTILAKAMDVLPEAVTSVTMMSYLKACFPEPSDIGLSPGDLWHLHTRRSYSREGNQILFTEWKATTCTIYCIKMGHLVIYIHINNCAGEPMRLDSWGCAMTGQKMNHRQTKIAKLLVNAMGENAPLY